VSFGLALSACGLSICLLQGCRSSEGDLALESDAVFEALPSEPERPPAAGRGIEMPLESPEPEAEPEAEAEAADGPRAAQGPKATQPMKAAQPQTGNRKPDAPKKLDPDELAFEFEKHLREVHVATLEQEIAERKARTDQAAAADAVEAAERAHVSALRALDQYSKVEQLVLLAEAQLKIDRATFKLEASQQEHEQMQRAYANPTDEHTAETGKLVLWRTEAEVAFQQRAVDLELGQRRILEDFTIPEKISQLEGEVSKTERALARARETLERELFEAELAVTQARNKLSLAKYELGRAPKRPAEGN
jgi:hypothetical protein